MLTDNILDLEELDEEITKGLIFHQSKNRDFSYKIEPDYETKVLTVKTLHLNEQAN